MIDELNAVLKELVNGDDEHSKKIAEHIQKINALHKSSEISNEDYKELLEDANQIIEVEKEAATLEAKVKLEQASKLLMMLVKIV